MQRDPIEYLDGSNVYTYVGATPVDKLDPQGTAGQTYADCVADCLSTLALETTLCELLGAGCFYLDWYNECQLPGFPDYEDYYHKCKKQTKENFEKCISNCITYLFNVRPSPTIAQPPAIDYPDFPGAPPPIGYY